MKMAEKNWIEGKVEFHSRTHSNLFERIKLMKNNSIDAIKN